MEKDYTLKSFIYWCGNENEGFIRECTEEDAKEYFIKECFTDSEICCPYCGADSDKVSELKGKTKRYKCYNCRNQFSERVGTFLQKSKLTYKQVILGIWLMYNEKGISSIKLAEELNLTQKTSWYFMKDIREVHNI